MAIQRQALEQHDAQRVDVGPPVDPATLGCDLLGRHVAGCAQAFARFGDRLGDLVGRLRSRQTEVQDHRFAVAGQDHVAGLEVTVDHARLVRFVHRAREGFEQSKDPRPGATGGAAEPGGWILRSRVPQVLRQSPAVHEPHDHVGHAVELAGFVDRTDRRVVEVGRSRGFPLHPSPHRFVSRELLAQDLQRDFVRGVGLSGEKNPPHPAGAELAHDLELAESLASREAGLDRDRLERCEQAVSIFRGLHQRLEKRVVGVVSQELFDRFGEAGIVSTQAAQPLPVVRPRATREVRRIARSRAGVGRSPRRRWVGRVGWSGS